MGGVMVAAVVALALSIRCVVATDYIVGEGMCVPAEWGSPAECVGDYNTWALTHEFAVGDQLVFSFAVGYNNVAEVTRQDYDRCQVSTPTNPIYVNKRSPATIPLSKTGTFYFVSTGTAAIAYPSLCPYQRLAVTVNATTSSPSTPIDDQTPSTTTSAITATPATSSSSSSSHSTMVKAVVGSVVGFVLFAAKIFLIVHCVHRRRMRQRVKLSAEMGSPPVNHDADHTFNAH